MAIATTGTRSIFNQYALYWTLALAALVVAVVLAFTAIADSDSHAPTTPVKAQPASTYQGDWKDALTDSKAAPADTGSWPILFSGVR